MTEGTITLPPHIGFMMGSSVEAEANMAVADKYKLSIGELSGLAFVVAQAFNKKFELPELEFKLAEELKITPDVARTMARDVLGLCLLPADAEHFGGAVAKALTGYGGDPEEFAASTEEFKRKLAAEEAAEEAEARESVDTELMEEKIAKTPMVITDPEAEKNSLVKIFATNLKDTLKYADYELKTDLNARLVYLLIRDESGDFQKRLLDAVYGNSEKLTEKPFRLKGEILEPTIANWLKDYINFVGVEQVVSTIKKAQYYVNAESVKSLTEEEKNLLDRLLDVYIAIKNFTFNIRKFSVEELFIFPYTREEAEAYQQQAERERREKEAESVGVLDTAETPASIKQQFLGREQDRLLIASEKDKIIEATRKEFDRVSDMFENYLVERQKIGIIACLEILAEIGALDTVISQDERFRRLLFGYFDRNNLADEKNFYYEDASAPRIVEHFLKYVFLERLGLPEMEGARLAVGLANIFRAKGDMKYAQLAYFDMASKKFKWA